MFFELGGHRLSTDHLCFSFLDLLLYFYIPLCLLYDLDPAAECKRKSLKRDHRPPALVLLFSLIEIEFFKYLHHQIHPNLIESLICRHCRSFTPSHRWRQLTIVHWQLIPRQEISKHPIFVNNYSPNTPPRRSITSDGVRH